MAGREPYIHMDPVVPQLVVRALSFLFDRVFSNMMLCPARPSFPLSDDLLFAICGHLDTLQQLAMLSRVNRAFRDHLRRSVHWLRVGRLVCGEAYWWPDPGLERTRPMEATRLCVCPWASAPVEITDADERQGILDTATHMASEQGEAEVIEHLCRIRWAPQDGHGYGEYHSLIRVHSSAFLLTVHDVFITEEDRIRSEYFTYVISNRCRLLRDMYSDHRAERFANSSPIWLRREGSPDLYLRFTDRILRFGPGAPTAPPSSARVIQGLFWAAHRGNVAPALRQISLIEDTRFHGKTLAILVVDGGSLPALKQLLDCAPQLVVRHHGAYVRAVESGRDDMARLIASRLPGRRGYCSSGVLWSVLACQVACGAARVEGEVVDVNLECAGAISYVLNHPESYDNFAHRSSMRLLCSLCVESRRLTSDGVSMADLVVDSFLPRVIQFVGRAISDASLVQLRARIRWVAELMRPGAFYGAAAAVSMRI